MPYSPHIGSRVVLLRAEQQLRRSIPQRHQVWRERVQRVAKDARQAEVGQHHPAVVGVEQIRKLYISTRKEGSKFDSVISLREISRASLRA